MLRKNLHADLLKMKGLPIVLAHILIPVIISGLFLVYYSFSVWSENTKIIAFYQAVGAGFPVLIGIFTASIMEQEQNAGVCQNLLTLRKKTVAFLSKVILLLVFSLFSVLLTAVTFGFGFYKILVFQINVTTFCQCTCWRRGNTCNDLFFCLLWYKSFYIIR